MKYDLYVFAAPRTRPPTVDIKSSKAALAVRTQRPTDDEENIAETVEQAIESIPVDETSPSKSDDKANNVSRSMRTPSVKEQKGTGIRSCMQMLNPGQALRPFFQTRALNFTKIIIFTKIMFENYKSTPEISKCVD